MNKSDFFKRNNGPILFAHRGCSHAAPENTLTAFGKAKENHIPGVELDVRLCASGEMAVFHDDNFKRIFGIEGSIEETPFEKLRELDAGGHKAEEFRGEKVPLLSEVFELLGPDMLYDIEIKNRKKVTGPQEKELLRLLKKHGMESKVLISSFNPLSVKTFRKIAPDIPAAVIYTNTNEMPWYLRRGEGRYISGCEILKPKHLLINDRYMALNHRLLKYPIIPWTVDDPERAKELLEMGVSGIVSNRPEDLKELF